MFVRHRVFSKTEIRSRCEILLENYTKTIQIEALTMIDMARKEISAAVWEYQKLLAETIAAKKSAGVFDTSTEEALLAKVSRLGAELYAGIERMETAARKGKEIRDSFEGARFCRDSVVPVMGDLRRAADELETLISSKYWPYPTYGEILYSVR